MKKLRGLLIRIVAVMVVVTGVRAMRPASTSACEVPYEIPEGGYPDPYYDCGCSYLKCAGEQTCFADGDICYLLDPCTECHYT
jgi:hypothetical protein